MDGRQILCFAIGVGMWSLFGCDRTPAAREPYQPQPLPIPALTSAEMHALVQSSEQPVVVEFGVEFGCVRCDDMRSQVAELSRELAGTASVIRVDFNANRQLASGYGANICPSYVIFDQGQAVSVRSYPTSADMIRIDLQSRE